MNMEIPDFKGLILKPRKTYEDMLDQADWKKGLAAWFLFSSIGLAAYFLLAAAVKSNYMFMNFGFGAGYVSFLSMGIGLTTFFGFFIIRVGLCHAGARILKGSGTFSTTLGLFGYANILTSLNGFLSGILTVFYVFFIREGMRSIIMEGTMNVHSLAYLTYISIAAIVLFEILFTWLQSAAVSVSYQIARWKSLLIVFGSGIIVSLTIMRVYILFLGGLL